MRLDVSAVISRQIFFFLPVRIREESPLTAAPGACEPVSASLRGESPERLFSPRLERKLRHRLAPPVRVRCWPAAASNRHRVTASFCWSRTQGWSEKCVRQRDLCPVGEPPPRRWALMSEPIGPYRDHMVSEGLVHKHMWPPITTGSVGTPTGAPKYLPEASFYKLKRYKCEFNRDFSGLNVKLSSKDGACFWIICSLFKTLIERVRHENKAEQQQQMSSKLMHFLCNVGPWCTFVIVN